MPGTFLDLGSGHNLRIRDPPFVADPWDLVDPWDLAGLALVAPFYLEIGLDIVLAYRGWGFLRETFVVRDHVVDSHDMRLKYNRVEITVGRDALKCMVAVRLTNEE